jgi:hypothetical protein
MNADLLIDFNTFESSPSGGATLRTISLDDQQVDLSADHIINSGRRNRTLSQPTGDDDCLSSIKQQPATIKPSDFGAFIGASSSSSNNLNGFIRHESMRTTIDSESDNDDVFNERSSRKPLITTGDDDDSNSTVHYSSRQQRISSIRSGTSNRRNKRRHHSPTDNHHIGSSHRRYRMLIAFCYILLTIIITLIVIIFRWKSMKKTNIVNDSSCAKITAKYITNVTSVGDDSAIVAAHSRIIQNIDKSSLFLFAISWFHFILSLFSITFSRTYNS